jgi:hypothetical protein
MKQRRTNACLSSLVKMAAGPPSLLLLLLAVPLATAWMPQSGSEPPLASISNGPAAANDVALSRRRTLTWIVSSAIAANTNVLPLPIVVQSTPFSTVPAAWAAETSEMASSTATTTVLYDFHNRNRQNNAGAVIRDDYWYVLGQTPPQLLTAPIVGDDPQWNAFGSCTTSTGTNSCTYVSLSQRSAAYTKYASSIAYGARDYQQLGTHLASFRPNDDDSGTSNEDWWRRALLYVQTEPGVPPPPAVDAELKMVLLATALLTSPNFPGPSRPLLVARFYANEVRFAHRQIQAALVQRDYLRARQAYDFGRDSWNSYFQVVARTIVPKVGEPFIPIV